MSRFLWEGIMRELNDSEWVKVTGGTALIMHESMHTSLPTLQAPIPHRRFPHPVRSFQNTQSKIYKPATLSYKPPYVNR